MAKYTVELRTIVESGFNVFDFPYTFYDPARKKDFEDLFIRHFKYREICCETVGRWVDYLRDKLDLELPYYNELLQTKLLEYSILDNYKINETTARDLTMNGTVSGNASQNGTTNNTTTTNENGTNLNTLNREVDGVITGVKDSLLNSTTDHTDKTEFERDQTLTDKSTNKKTSEKTADLKKVHSDTPQSLVSASNISGNIYASDVEINDNGENVEDNETLSNTKTDKNTETTDKTTKDTVAGTTKDTSTDTTDETTKETSTGSAQSSGSAVANGSFGNMTNTAQTSADTHKEVITRSMTGNIGVDTDADMIQKHIKLQQILTTIYFDFFDHCEDLFMQVY